MERESIEQKGKAKRKIKSIKKEKAVSVRSSVQREDWETLLNRVI